MRLFTIHEHVKDEPPLLQLNGANILHADDITARMAGPHDTEAPLPNASEHLLINERPDLRGRNGDPRILTSAKSKATGERSYRSTSDLQPTGPSNFRASIAPAGKHNRGGVSASLPCSCLVY